MNAFYIILAACPVLLLGVVAFLVLIAVGVRKGDRRDLASPANVLALEAYGLVKHRCSCTAHDP